MPRPDGSPTTTERGLGYRHQAARKRLLPRFVGTPCPGCGVTLTPMNMDFDHELPRAQGGTVATRFLCRRCNRSRGQALGRARTRARRRVVRLVTSRAW